MVFIILIVAIMGTAGWLYRQTILRLARSQRESIIISRDLRNTFDIVKKHLTTISGIVKKEIPAETRNLEFQTVKKQIVEALDNAAEYVSGDIERLK